MAITRVELHPKIVFGGAKQPSPADLEWLHDKGSAQRGAGTRYFAWPRLPAKLV